MGIISILRKIYRKFIHWPWLDKMIYKALDFLTNILCYFYGFSFPKNYIRRWKLDMLWKLYEQETVALFKKIIKPGMTIVDVGAHIGYFTRVFSRLAGKNGMVYAFEADPENFRLLKKNTAHLKNARLFQLAVSDRAGETNFYRSEKNGCHSIVNLPQNKEIITVSTVDLDSLFIGTEKTQKINLIKIDIEGGETTALKGMAKILNSNQNIALVIEFNIECLKMAGMAPTDFIKTLSNLEFKIFAIKTNGLNAINPQETAPEKYLLPGAAFVNLCCARNDNLDFNFSETRR